MSLGTFFTDADAYRFRTLQIVAISKMDETLCAWLFSRKMTHYFHAFSFINISGSPYTKVFTVAVTQLSEQVHLQRF